MKRRERVSSFLIVEAGLILLNILCYGDIRWLLLEQILLFPCFNVLKRKKREKEKHLYKKNRLQSILLSQDGMGVVEVILIIVVLIGLVIIFQTNIKGVVASIFSTIQKNAGSIR